MANDMVVPRKNGKLRVCIDYANLNKSCLKDFFRLPHIDQLIDAIVRHELLSFLDASSGYNQIRMGLEDQEKMSFITNKGTYCII